MVALVDLVVVLIGTLLLLSSEALRTRRTYVFLAALALAIVGANLLAEPARFISKSTAISVFVIVVLRYQHVLVGVTRFGSEADRKLRRISVDVNRALATWDTGESARRRAALVCKEAMAELESIEPPTDEWQRTLALMHRYLSELYGIAGDHGSPRPEHARMSDLENLRDEVGRAWSTALRPSRR